MSTSFSPRHCCKGPISECSRPGGLGFHTGSEGQAQQAGSGRALGLVIPFPKGNGSDGGREGRGPRGQVTAPTSLHSCLPFRVFAHLMTSS